MLSYAVVLLRSNFMLQSLPVVNINKPLSKCTVKLIPPTNPVAITLRHQMMSLAFCDIDELFGCSVNNVLAFKKCCVRKKIIVFDQSGLF